MPDIYEYEESYVAADLVDGKVELRVVFYDVFDHPGADEVMTKWGTGDEEVGVTIRFSTDAALNCMIETHQHRSGEIDASNKPLFDALREELQAQIERIDALRFVG